MPELNPMFMAMIKFMAQNNLDFIVDGDGDDADIMILENATPYEPTITVGQFLTIAFMQREGGELVHGSSMRFSGRLVAGEISRMLQFLVTSEREKLRAK